MNIIIIVVAMMAGMAVSASAAPQVPQVQTFDSLKEGLSYETTEECEGSLGAIVSGLESDSQKRCERKGVDNQCGSGDKSFTVAYVCKSYATIKTFDTKASNLLFDADSCQSTLLQMARSTPTLDVLNRCKSNEPGFAFVYIGSTLGY